MTCGEVPPVCRNPAATNGLAWAEQRVSRARHPLCGVECGGWVFGGGIRINGGDPVIF